MSKLHVAGIVAILVISVINLAQCTDYVPVFMWGATTGASEKAKALGKLSGERFADVLSDQLDSKPFTVVFIEETLSVEDFTGKLANRKTPFPGLHEKITGESVIYLPFVASALHTLNKQADPEKIDRVHLTAEGLSADITPGSGQYLFINLKDARENEDRRHMLSRHDEFMTEMFDKLLKKHDNVLAIYTGRYPSWEVTESYPRKGRSLLANEEGELGPMNGFYNVADKIYLYSPSMVLKREGDENGTTLYNGVPVLQNSSDSEMELNIKFDTVSVNFRFFEDIDYYWYISGVNVSDGKGETLELKGVDVYAGMGFSYHCSPAGEFTDGNSSLILNDFQVQPFFGMELGQSRFELAYDCQGFTSVPIWSGLFVVFLLLIISSIAVTMMLDIRTMDRFDDPKGKTITIMTSE